MVLNLSKDTLSDEDLLSVGINTIVQKPLPADTFRQHVLRLLEDLGPHTH
jgi:hypothetical protein